MTDAHKANLARDILLIMYSRQEIQAIARDPVLRRQAIEQCRAVEKFLGNLRVLQRDCQDGLATTNQRGERNGH